jgi:hypothetical protein
MASVLSKAVAKFKTGAAKAKLHLRMTPSDPDLPLIGVPVRELLTQLFIYRRDKAMRSLAMYATFVAIFIGVILSIDITTLAYTTNAAIGNIFLGNPLADATYLKTFAQIGTFEEVESWLNSVVAPGLYPTVWYNGDPMSSLDKQFLVPNVQLLGGAKLWVGRVTNGSSSCSDIQLSSSEYQRNFQLPGNPCYGPFIPGVSEDTSPFGPSQDPQRYKYYSAVSSTDVSGVSGMQQRSYGRGGYAVYLPMNATEGLKVRSKPC